MIEKYMPLDAESRRLVDWMEKGVCDAFHKKYLETLFFCVCKEVNGPMIDNAFSFSFANSDSQEVSMNINRSGTKKGEFNSPTEITPSQMRSSTCKMVRTLIRWMGTLDKMPEQRTVLMKKLFYYDDVTPFDFDGNVIGAGVDAEIAAAIQALQDDSGASLHPVAESRERDWSDVSDDEEVTSKLQTERDEREDRLIPVCLRGQDGQFNRVSEFSLRECQGYSTLAGVIKGKFHFQPPMVGQDTEHPHVCWPWGANYQVEYLSEEDYGILDPLTLWWSVFMDKLGTVHMTPVEGGQMVTVRLSTNDILTIPRREARRGYPRFRRLLYFYSAAYQKLEPCDETTLIIWPGGDIFYYAEGGNRLPIPPMQAEFQHRRTAPWEFNEERDDNGEENNDNGGGWLITMEATKLMEKKKQRNQSITCGWIISNFSLSL